MATVPVLVLPVSLLHRRPSSPPTTLPTLSHIHNFFTPIFTSSSTNKTTTVHGINPSDSRRDNPLFLDENNAVVDDMDGYLNNLSLEYESVWDTKPAWCQPWTIVLTGFSIVAISWLIFQSVVVTSAISLLIFAWWYIFLYSYPKEAFKRT
ncbi:uncharacterized protein LOC127126144 isoform X2 [Lathyrus oleraceus]|uniref:DUF6737 domain-containing protein n=1 Tax=Pisum sativum TaxID=3888 RepID=A0A9D5AYE0_PEA|nr:uncharacterized protein LOC127126144 isoform X2 [Pisum sativum]KAI5426668.1 hypothetical protein KIW84_032194 [Pisum sativum]